LPPSGFSFNRKSKKPKGSCPVRKANRERSFWASLLRNSGQRKEGDHGIQGGAVREQLSERQAVPSLL
jgi:hypothetical protein